MRVGGEGMRSEVCGEGVCGVCGCVVRVCGECVIRVCVGRCVCGVEVWQGVW